jgi:hypothetical protein
LIAVGALRAPGAWGRGGLWLGRQTICVFSTTILCAAVIGKKNAFRNPVSIKEIQTMQKK